MWRQFKEWLRRLWSRQKGEGTVPWDNQTQAIAENKWEKLNKILQQHSYMLAEAEEAQRRYDGDYDILRREKKRLDDPNHRIVTNYARMIVNMKVNYMLGKPVSYDVPKSIDGVLEEVLSQFEEDLRAVMEENDDEAVTFEAVRDGLIARVATVLFYWQDGEIRYRSYTLNECIPVVDASGELVQAIHRYKDEEKEYIEIYDSRTVTYLVRDGDGFMLDDRYGVNPAVHYLPIVPAAIFINGKPARPHFCKIAHGVSELGPDIRTLLEEYSRIISDNANRMDVFCDPYILMRGAQITRDEMLEMRQARAIRTDDPSSEVSYLEWSQESSGVDSHADRILDTIFEVSSTPKIYKQEAAGALSSVAIRQLYTPLDNAVNEKEVWLNKFIRRKLMIITLMLNAKYALAEGKEPETYERYDWRWVDWRTNRNLPQNLKEEIETLLQLKGTISDFTLLQNIPFVENAEDEMDRIRQEKLDTPRVNLKDITGHLDNQNDRMKKRSMNDDAL
ncbi:phage portal protein [Aneurinibacillus aneurinilyticus]|uniref:phage portal protein n=1 Tax=Aneurinibacillus aneurinilyticus TaxID=1391 RepID=UPI0035259240